MGLLSWILFGIIVGALAKIIMPGDDPGNMTDARGIAITAVIGIVGAMIGGFIGSLLHLGSASEFSLKGFALAIIGSLILLYGYRKYTESQG